MRTRAAERAWAVGGLGTPALQTSSLLFQTHTCQFKVGFLQGAQQNVLWLQIQVRDTPFMQELQGTSWRVRRPTRRNRSEEPILHLPLAPSSLTSAPLSLSNLTSALAAVLNVLILKYQVPATSKNLTPTPLDPFTSPLRLLEASLAPQSLGSCSFPWQST